MLRFPFVLSLALLAVGCTEPAPETAPRTDSGAELDASDSTASAATSALPVVVYKTATCGCCVAWAAHMDSAGRYALTQRDVTDLNAVKAHLGVPARVASCHTATVDGFVIEGHVPETEVARLLAERPEGVVGLSVPGMPVGSPGMEVPGQPADRYDVLALHADGTTSVFARH